MVVHHHRQPGGEVWDCRIDEMLARVVAADGWYPPTVGHPSRHLHVVSPTHTADVGVRQHEVLQVQSDLADIVVHRLDHETAHGGEGGGAGKYCSVLRRLRIALASEGAAGPEASSAGPSSLTPPSPALGAGVTDSVSTCMRGTEQSELRRFKAEETHLCQWCRPC